MSVIQLAKPPALFYATGIVDLRLSSAVKRHIYFVLEYTEGDVKWAADELAINNSTLYRYRQRMNQYKTIKPQLLHQCLEIENEEELCLE